MKSVGSTILVCLALLGLFALGVVSCERAENPRSSFATYKEMEEAGMIEAGWLPSYLPRSATDIQEGHNIDTNEVWASFKYDVGDTSVVGESCKVLIENDRGRKYLCPPFESETVVLILRADGTADFASYQNEI